jgi:hypothetical protein
MARGHAGPALVPRYKVLKEKVHIPSWQHPPPVLHHITHVAQSITAAEALDMQV